MARQSDAARNFEQIPVKIAAKASGANRPPRDLFVSPGHAVLLDQTSALAKSLLNGITVTQGKMPETGDYFPPLPWPVRNGRIDSR